MPRWHSSAAFATPSNRSLRPSCYRFFHTGPQHFAFSNSIPTARALFPSARPSLLMQSVCNAIVQLTLRGASRLGGWRKALQNPVGGRHSQGLRQRKLCHPYRRERSQPTAAAECAIRLDTPLPLGNRAPLKRRKGSRARASGNGPKSAESTRRPDSQVSA
jgi:hypothetical protein